MGKIQNEDVKSYSDLLAASPAGTKSQLPNYSKVYMGDFGNDLTFQEIFQQRLVHGSPMLLHAATTPDSKLYIDASAVPTIEGMGKVIPPIGNTIPAVSASTLDFQGSHATTGASFTVSWPTSTVGKFRRMGLTLISDGSIQALFTASEYTLLTDAQAVDPATVLVSSGLPLGFIDLECTDVAGKFKTAGSATSVIENKVSGVPRIFIFGSGGGAGSGSATGASKSPASGYQAILSDDFSVGPTLAATKVDSTYTKATYNTAKTLYQLNCDKTKTVSSNSGTTLVISSSVAWLAAGDIVYVASGARSGQWRRITVVASTTLTLDAAFTGGNASASDALMLSQAVWSKDWVNIGTGSPEFTRPRDFFPSTNIPSVNVDYKDSLTAADDIADEVATARVVVSISNSGAQTDTGLATSDTFASIFTRVSAPLQNLNYSLLNNATKQRLFLCFFANPNNASVTTTANVLEYDVSVYEEAALLNGGYLQSAFCFSDSSGTAINCTNPTVVSTKTRVALSWNYVPGLNPGQTTGDLEVIVDGQVIPRYLSGSTVDAFYTETAGTTNTLDLWTDLSAYQRSIEIRRRQGSIDSSATNAVILAGLQELTVGTAAQVTSGQAKYSSLQTALSLLPSGGKIMLVGTPITEAITVTAPNTMIDGKGRLTQITGTVTLNSGADYCLIRGVRITDNVTMSSNKSYIRECWLASGKTVTIGGGTFGNDAEYMPE
jgi:hypothetical protein